MMKKIAALGLFLTVPAALFAWNTGAGGCGYGFRMGPHMFGGFYGGGLIMWIITLALLGFLLYTAVKYFKNRGADTGSKETALEILKVRYAKGEITKEEFTAMKGDLG
jgi:putative membrane protein